MSNNENTEKDMNLSKEEMLKANEKERARVYNENYEHNNLRQVAQIYKMLRDLKKELDTDYQKMKDLNELGVYVLDFPIMVILKDIMRVTYDNAYYKERIELEYQLIKNLRASRNSLKNEKVRYFIDNLEARLRNIRCAYDIKDAEQTKKFKTFEKDLYIIATKLEEFCHKKDCNRPSACPNSHEHCREHLNLTTALAWSLKTSIKENLPYLSEGSQQILKGFMNVKSTALTLDNAFCLNGEDLTEKEKELKELARRVHLISESILNHRDVSGFASYYNKIRYNEDLSNFEEILESYLHPQYADYSPIYKHSEIYGIDNDYDDDYGDDDDDEDEDDEDEDDDW